jgi:hypothetical protein
MNIFILNRDPTLAAQQQCDKHVVKMILESAQMLSTVHRLLDGNDWADANLLYRSTHKNHPCTVWTRESSTNYKWHYEHFLALCYEYTYRYGKTHLSETKFINVLDKLPNNIPQGKMTPFKLAMAKFPECIKEDAVESYKLYYHTKLDNMSMVWTKRKQPEWFNAST